MEVEFGLKVEFDKLDFQAILMYLTWSYFEVEFDKNMTKIKMKPLTFVYSIRPVTKILNFKILYLNNFIIVQKGEKII